MVHMISPRNEHSHPKMAPSNPLEELYGRPGFMIRRVHQIAVSLFLEETGAQDIASTGEAAADFAKSDKPMPRTTAA